MKLKEEAKHKINLLTEVNDGIYPFEYEDGGRSSVKAREANGLGVRLVRIFYLPEEIDTDAIKVTLKEYGEVLAVREETWSDQYRFKVKNGIRNAKMELRKHIPSYVNVNGCQAVIMYDDQPRTCAVCNSEKHFRSDCPMKKRVTTENNSAPLSYAEVTKRRGEEGGEKTLASEQRNVREEEETGLSHTGRNTRQMSKRRSEERITDRSGGNGESVEQSKKWETAEEN